MDKRMQEKEEVISNTLTASRQLHSFNEWLFKKVFFFSSLAERAITAVPVTALQKEAIVTSSAMPRFHQAETKNKGRQNKRQPSKTNNTTPTKHKPKTKHLSGNRAAYSCTTYN